MGKWGQLSTAKCCICAFEKTWLAMKRRMTTGWKDAATVIQWSLPQLSENQLISKETTKEPLFNSSIKQFLATQYTLSTLVSNRDRVALPTPSFQVPIPTAPHTTINASSSHLPCTRRLSIPRTHIRFLHPCLSAFLHYLLGTSSAFPIRQNYPFPQWHTHTHTPSAQHGRRRLSER